jgi:hypothetical protein
MSQHVSVVLPLAVLVLAQWAEQWPVREKVRVDLLRRDYEIGVRYDDAVASVVNPCLADDWSVAIDWGEGKAATIPTKRDAPQVPCGGSGCVPEGGPYKLWSDHAFAVIGTYYVRIEPRIHCFGTKGGAVPYPSEFPASVYARVPLSRISLSRSVAAPGDKVTLRVRLAGLAPPSGTRVFLRASPTSLPWLPEFIDVKPMMREGSRELVVSGPAGKASIAASTDPERPLRVSLQVKDRK